MWTVIGQKVCLDSSIHVCKHSCDFLDSRIFLRIICKSNRALFFHGYSVHSLI